MLFFLNASRTGFSEIETDTASAWFGRTVSKRFKRFYTVSNSDIYFPLLSLLLVGLFFLNCSRQSPLDNDEPPPGVSKTADNRPVRYVAIDIDDIFMPNWDADKQVIGTVKMSEADVNELIRLSKYLRVLFGNDFKFTVGYNSGFFDSTFAGDMAFLRNSQEFSWFNHLPRHEKIYTNAYSAEKVETLFRTGNAFAEKYGVLLSKYMVTPRHEGIWPPYEPLYANFEKFGIRYTSFDGLTRPEKNGNVSIFPRCSIGFGSTDYAYSQVPRDRITLLCQYLYKNIMNSQATIIYSHQSNFARDRLARELFMQLAVLLKAQKKYRIQFVTSERLAGIALGNPAVLRNIPAGVQ